VLEVALLGVGVSLVRPGAAWARTGEPRHDLTLDLPILAEDSTAVPVRVSVAHPMEPDHFIRLITVRLDADPVPDKGTYRFTPANGQAWVAFPMRSGAGGRVTATAECTRHGRFTASREVRVASDGCAGTDEGGGRGPRGSPRLRVPDRVRRGEVVEVRARLLHDSDTGLRLRGGRHVREQPEVFVRQMQVYLDQQLVSDFRLTSAVSPNPIVRFPLRVAGPARLRVVFVNSEGQRWEASQPLSPGP
jgi:sulfur-oxidizing protein SoxY